MSTIYREICNYAVTKDGKAYFLNFDYLKNSGFGYSNTIYTSYQSYTTNETFPLDEDMNIDCITNGEYLPCLLNEDLVSLVNGNPTNNMKIILNSNKISDIQFDKVVSFYFKYYGLALDESWCSIFNSNNTVMENKLTIDNYDEKTFKLLDFSEEYLLKKMNIKEII